MMDYLELDEICETCDGFDVVFKTCLQCGGAGCQHCEENGFVTTDCDEWSDNSDYNASRYDNEYKVEMMEDCE